MAVGGWSHQVEVARAILSVDCRQGVTSQSVSLIGGQTEHVIRVYYAKVHEELFVLHAFWVKRHRSFASHANKTSLSDIGKW